MGCHYRSIPSWYHRELSKLHLTFGSKSSDGSLMLIASTLLWPEASLYADHWVRLCRIPLCWTVSSTWRRVSNCFRCFQDTHVQEVMRGHESFVTWGVLHLSSSKLVLSCSYFLLIWYTICSNALHVIAVYKTICNFVRTKFGWAEGGTEGFVRPSRYFINVAGQLQKAATSPLSCLGETGFCDSNDSCDRHGVICCWTYSIPLVSRIFPNLPCSNSGHDIIPQRMVQAVPKIVTMPSRLWRTSTLPVPYPSLARFEGGSLGFDGIRVKTEARFNFHVHNMQWYFLIYNNILYYNIIRIYIYISFCLCHVSFHVVFNPVYFWYAFHSSQGST